MNKVVVNNFLLARHSFWSSCGSNLEALARKDYPNANYFCGSDISALDLDLYEAKKVKGITDRGCTIDGVLGIALDFQSKKFISSQLLLVELKLNNESTKGFSCGNIRKKVSHSIDLLGADVQIHSNYLVVFENTIASKFVSSFHRWVNENELPKGVEAISVDEFQKCLISPSNWPIKSKYTESHIKDGLFVHILDFNIHEFIKKCDFWLAENKKAYYANDYATCDVICKSLREIICEVKELDNLTQDDLLELEILEEELYC